MHKGKHHTPAAKLKIKAAVKKRWAVARRAKQFALTHEIVEEPLNETNPKTLMGRLKLPMLSVIPPTALIYFGAAMRNGAAKYGPYNWRDKPIEAMVYIDAAIRHLCQWTDGEDLDADSQAWHLGHAMATLGILADAIENGTVIDDRPKVRSKQSSRLLAVPK